jgi:hypothetical protein
MQKDLWLKFGCFLTGYDHALVLQSSRSVAKMVKKNLSALLIISTVWGLVGYVFTSRYLRGEWWMSVAGAAIMVFIIIQIERQIILSVGKNRLAIMFRVLIGVVMAVIGSVILDQILFKEDVEKAQMVAVQTEVDSLLPRKSRELSKQIAVIDSAIGRKESERTAVNDEVTKKPTITTVSTESAQERDSTGRLVTRGRKITKQDLPNPKIAMIESIDAHIKALRSQKERKDSMLLNMQQVIESELKSKTGFLDELKVLFSVLLSSSIALIVWILIFLFFLMIELFILVNKFGDDKNDYDRLLQHQIDVRIKMIDKLTHNA